MTDFEGLFAALGDAGVEMVVVGGIAVIRAKAATGRAKDLVDLEALRKLAERSS